MRNLRINQNCNLKMTKIPKIYFNFLYLIQLYCGRNSNKIIPTFDIRMFYFTIVAKNEFKKQTNKQTNEKKKLFNFEDFHVFVRGGLLICGIS